MTDEPITTTQESIPAAEPQKTDTPMIPKTRFDEVNAKLKALERQQAEQAAAIKTAEEAQLAETGKYRELWEKQQAEYQSAQKTLESLQPRHEAAMTALESLWQQRKSILPEPVLKLAEKMDVIERLTWLAENETSFTRPAQGTPTHQKPSGNAEPGNPFVGKVKARF